MDIETFISGDGQTTEWRLAGGALAADHDIKTALLISLFSDRRAEDDDVLPGEAGGRRGFWGDAFAQRRIGSRLWLLGREKQLTEVVNRAREYAQEAVQWLVDDGICDSVAVDAAVIGKGTLGLSVVAKRNAAAPLTYKFAFAWNGTGNLTA